MSSFRISDEEARRIRDLGGPTFAPRARGRFLCNQLPDRGSLSPTKVSVVKSRVNAVDRSAKPKKPGAKRLKKKEQVAIVTSPDFYWEGIICPNCGKIIYDWEVGQFKCPGCDGAIKVVRR